ncbi:MAG: magnesium chelatase ATPase subunit D, partial [Pseudomonadota bacterium]
MSEEAPGVRWHRALLALRLLALDPGLGGIALRARAGPVRDRWMNALARFPLTVRKVPVTIGDDALFGGLDLAATLASGREQRTAGLLSCPALLTVPMAERMEPGLAARLASAVDGGAHSLIALDEGADEEEGIPDALADRLAFHVSLDGIPCGAAAEELGTLPPMADVTASEADMAAIAELAETRGSSSTRAGLHCLRAARAHAALHRRGTVAPEDIEAAAILTLATLATRMPAPSEDEAPAPEHAEDHPQQDDEEGGASIPQELLLDAVRSALPPGLLAQLAAGSARRGARGAGTGTKRKGNRKGRPLPPRAGRPDGRARVDLVATLRAAAPWQSIRKAGRPSARPVEIRASDIHLKRFEERSDRLLIFTVDASGSAALARLAEAKGAIELLLSEAYARRDHVALVAFRGISAEVLLPPTRSLVQT